MKENKISDDRYKELRTRLKRITTILKAPYKGITTEELEQAEKEKIVIKKEIAQYIFNTKMSKNMEGEKKK